MKPPRYKQCVAAGLGVVLQMALAGSARADTLDYFQNRNSHSDWTPFQITSFDSSLGTLNSVTMSVEVNVSGSAQLWSPEEDATLSVHFTTTFAAVPEMGWGPTIASFSDSSPLWYYDYDLGEGYAQLDGSGNKVAFNTITGSFGRFTGEDSFDIALQLFGQATSTGEGDTLISSYDGSATLYYSYDYTVIPEPTSTVLIGMSLPALLAFRRRRDHYCRQ
jgi:hypothetical protein